MIGITLLLVAAAVGHALAAAIRLPAPPFLVAAGIAVAWMDGGRDASLMRSLLLLWVLVLVFAGGAELNPHRFARHLKLVVRVAVAQFVALAGIAFAIAAAFTVSWIEAAYLALAVATSSTFVVLRVLRRRRMLHDTLGRLVLGVLLVQDTIAMLMLGGIGRFDEGWVAMESGVLRSAGLLAAAWMLAQTAVPWLLTALDLDEETQLVVVLALLFGFMGLAHLLALPLVIGAFAAGFAVSTFPVNAVIRGQLGSLSDFFVSIFFVATGAVLALPSLADLGLALSLIAVVVLVTPPLVSWMAERGGVTAREALQGGLVLAQASEFSLVAALTGYAAGHIREETLSVVAIVTVATMVGTQVLASESVVWRLMRLPPRRKTRRPARALEGHVVVLGAGPNTEGLVEGLVSRGEQVVVVDHDPVVVGWAERRGATGVRGDAAEPAVLREVAAERARLVVSTLRHPPENVRVARQLRGTSVLVRVFESAEAEAVEREGAVAVCFSDAAAGAFFEWFDAREPAGAAQGNRI